MKQIVQLVLVGLSWCYSPWTFSSPVEAPPQTVVINESVTKFLLFWATPSSLESQMQMFLHTVDGFSRPLVEPNAMDLRKWGRGLAEHMLQVQYQDPDLDQLQSAIKKDSALREDLLKFCEANALLLLRAYTLAVYAREVRYQLDSSTRFGNLASALTAVSSACVAALGGLSTLYAHKSIKGAWVGAIPLGMYWGAKQIAEATSATQLSLYEIRAAHNFRRLKKATLEFTRTLD